MDRVPAFEAGSRRFEPYTAYHFINTSMHKPNSIFEAASNVLFGEAVELSAEDLKDIQKAFPSGAKINTWSGSLEWVKSGDMLAKNRLLPRERN